MIVVSVRSVGWQWERGKPEFAPQGIFSNAHDRCTKPITPSNATLGHQKAPRHLSVEDDQSHPYPPVVSHVLRTFMMPPFAKHHLRWRGLSARYIYGGGCRLLVRITNSAELVVVRI